jgi:hypothetical protein
VTITGANFTGATTVKLGPDPSPFMVVSDTIITATVPAGATTGNFSVTTPVGTTVSTAAFTVLHPPSISTFSPASGPVGSTVTITGAHFTGATTVKLGPDPSPFMVVSDTIITATVPTGATTGKFSVTTPNGTALSAASFTVLAPAPTIGDVLSHVQGSTLSAGVKRILSAPLRAADAAFDRGNTRAARALVGAFVNLVRALKRAGHVPAALADALAAQATAIEL